MKRGYSKLLYNQWNKNETMLSVIKRPCNSKHIISRLVRTQNRELFFWMYYLQYAQINQSRHNIDGFYWTLQTKYLKSSVPDHLYRKNRHELILIVFGPILGVVSVVIQMRQGNGLQKYYKPSYQIRFYFQLYMMNKMTIPRSAKGFQGRISCIDKVS